MLFTRSKVNPIIKPKSNSAWLSKKVYNPTGIIKDSLCHLFFRAVGDDWISRIGHATSEDGEKFKLDKKPIIEPTTKYESRGVEDPRLTKVGAFYFMTYTAFEGETARLSLAISKDLKIWTKQGLLLPNWDSFAAGNFIVKADEALNDKKKDKNWSKAGGVFSEKIDGKYLMLFGDRNLWLTESLDGKSWLESKKPFIKPRGRKYFDSCHIEMGPAPIKTKYGWLVIYHGIDNNEVYRLGWLLLDLKNPKKVIKRCQNPIFAPQEKYELSGLVDIMSGGMEKMSKMSAKTLDKFIKMNENKRVMPRVIFCCGATLHNDTLRIYYGASDTCVCTATASLKKILAG